MNQYCSIQNQNLVKQVLPMTSQHEAFNMPQPYQIDPNRNCVKPGKCFFPAINKI